MQVIVPASEKTEIKEMVLNYAYFYLIWHESLIYTFYDDDIYILLVEDTIKHE